MAMVNSGLKGLRFNIDLTENNYHVAIKIHREQILLHPGPISKRSYMSILAILSYCSMLVGWAPVWARHFEFTLK